MPDNFYIPITNTKKKLYTIFANLLLSISIIFFSVVKYNLYHNNTTNPVWSFIILPNFILLVFLVRLFYIFKLKKLHFTNFHWALLAAACWLSIGSWLIASALVVLGFLEYKVNRDMLCTINKKGIAISTFPVKKYGWAELNNVLLTQGIFTIDTKANKIFQVDISEEIIPFSESQLAAFVEQQLPK